MKKNKGLRRSLKYIALVIILLLVISYLLLNADFFVKSVLELTPKNSIYAAIVLLLLYVIKSATVFFPLILLEITAGHLFSTWSALGINFLGILIVLTIPYWIGHAAGMDAIQKLLQKYPKFREILDKQQDSSFFLCFIFRVISCLPGDIVTMYLGATKTPFWKNLVAGTLGVLPGMILATFIGESIQDPKSPMFWLSGGLRIILAALSVLLYYLYRRRIQKRKWRERNE